MFVRSHFEKSNDFIDWTNDWLKRIKEVGNVAPRPWINYYLAEALLKRNAPGDAEKAIELQDEAISIATELGMKPLLGASAG